MNADVYARMATLQEEHWWFRARRDVIGRVLESLALPEGARILEVGAGTGGNLALLRQFGDVRAMEGDAFARAHAAAVGGVEVVDGMLPDGVPFEDGTFDLVCLLDVLEHIDDERGALERVAKLITPNGRVLVTVPAYTWLWSQHDVAHHHKRRYTLSRLRAAGREAGLVPVRGGYFNTVLFPAIALVRLVGRLLGRGGRSDDAMPSPMVNTVFYRLFAAERRVLGHAAFPFGTSVFSVFARGERVA